MEWKKIEKEKMFQLAVNFKTFQFNSLPGMDLKLTCIWVALTWVSFDELEDNLDDR